MVIPGVIICAIVVSNIGLAVGICWILDAKKGEENGRAHR